MKPIKCSERMPPEGKDVLVFVYRLPAKETDEGRAWVGDESDQFGNPLGYLSSDVSHWCELPESPE